MSKLPNVSFFLSLQFAIIYTMHSVGRSVLFNWRNCRRADEMELWWRWSRSRLLFLISPAGFWRCNCVAAALTKLADLERRVLIQNVQSLYAGGKRPPSTHARNSFWRIIGDPLRTFFRRKKCRQHSPVPRSQPSDDCSALAAAFLEVSQHKRCIGIRALYSSGEIFEIWGTLAWEPFLSERFLQELDHLNISCNCHHYSSFTKWKFAILF